MFVLVIYFKYCWYDPYNWYWRVGIVVISFGFIFFICSTIYKIMVRKFCNPIKRMVYVSGNKLFVNISNSEKEEIVYIEFFDNLISLLTPRFIFTDLENAIEHYMKVSRISSPTLYPVFIIVTLPFGLVFLLVYSIVKVIVVITLSIVMSTLKDKEIICRINYLGEIRTKGFLAKSVKDFRKKHILTFFTKEEKERFITLFSAYISIKEV